jgi:two-component system KDP operon response regulator KdpE
MGELQARLRVAPRRRPSRGGGDDAAPESIEVGDLTIDFLRHDVTLAGQRLDVTRREFDFLAFLARHHDRVCTQRMIVEEVWGQGYANQGH